jgi:hypothetical protein
VKFCELCGRRMFGSGSSHDCCLYWHGLKPGRPCVACDASDRYWIDKGRTMPADKRLGAA